MWIFAKDGFLSLTQYRDRPDMLMVRARVAGDIEHFFPTARVIRTDDTRTTFIGPLCRVKRSATVCVMQSLISAAVLRTR